MSGNHEIKGLEEVSRKLDQLASRDAKSAVVSAIVYGILFLVMVIYGSVVGSMLREAATPDNISAMLSNAVQERLPELRASVNQAAAENAPLLADSLVKTIHDSFPLAEQTVKDIIDRQVDRVAETLKAELAPKFLEILDLNAESINLTAATIKDHSVAEALASLLVEHLDTEMEAIFNEQFHDSCGRLRENLEQLRDKPVAELTNKEAVERRLIANWVFIMEHGEVEEYLVMGQLGQVYEQWFQAFMEEIVDPSAIGE